MTWLIIKYDIDNYKMLIYIFLANFIEYNNNSYITFIVELYFW